MVHEPVVTKLWINGRVRDEWTDEVYDDKMETSEVQAERIRHQRRFITGAGCKSPWTGFSVLAGR